MSKAASKATRRETYLVTLTRPEGATKSDVIQLIFDGINTEAKMQHTEDPLYGDAVTPVSVKSLRVGP